MPILMIHGFGIDRHVVIGCMEPILKNRKGWKRIYFDLPGMGSTPAPHWLQNANQLLDALLVFIKKIIGKDPFLVVGESYGAYLARAIIKMIPEQLKGALLICPVVLADRNQRDLPKRQIFVKDTSFLATIKESEYKRLFERVLVVQDQTRWNRFTQDIIPGIRSKNREFLKQFQNLGYSLSFDIDQLQRPFNEPSLILVGRQDTSVGYRDSLKLLENFSRGTFAIMDRAGHGLEVEQESVFDCLVVEWLSRVANNAECLSGLHNIYGR